MKTFGMALLEVLTGALAAGVLAMIGTLQFQEAVVRCRVVETHRNINLLAVAMEAYYLENDTYPASDANSPLLPHGAASSMDPRLLTTPVTYTDVFLRDPFRAGSFSYLRVYGVNRREYAPPSYLIYPYNAYIAWSYGPDACTQVTGYRTLTMILANESRNPPQLGGQTPVELGGGGTIYNGMRYDPSNGIVSIGDIYRFGAFSE